MDFQWGGSSQPSVVSTSLAPVLTSSQPLIAPVCSIHPIQTRAKSGVLKPRTYLSTICSFAPVPLTISEALPNPHWKAGMELEFQALLKTKTWDLIPPFLRQTIVQCKWVFRTKYHADGTLDKYKGRLVAKGFQQTPSSG